MARFVYLLLLALAIAGQAGCGSIATTPADDVGISIVHELAAPPAIALPELAGAQAAGPPIETMVDMEPVDDSILASVLDGFTSSDWLPYENAQAPPKLALSSTTRTHPKWVFSQNNPSFDLPLQASLLPRSSAGSGTPTFTRATTDATHVGTAYQTDFEGKLNLVPAGAARFQGARYVKNLVATTSEDFSNAIWVVGNSGTAAIAVKTNNFGIAPDGAQTAARVQLDVSAGGAGDFSRLRNSASASLKPVWSSWIKTNDGTTVTIKPLHFSAVAGTITITPAWQRFSSSIATASGSFDYALVKGTTSDTADLLVWHPQLEDVTGQANQNPSEYVPALATANADSGSIGTRYFTTLNANTVTADNVVIEATGAPINSSAAEAAGGVAIGVVDSGGPLGYLSEGARINLAPRSQTFDLNWVRQNTTITPDQAASPDGTVTADLMFPTTTGNNRFISQDIANTVAPYTWSVLAKSAGKNFLTYFDPPSGLTNVWFNLATCAVGTNLIVGATASTKAYPNGWCQVILTMTSAVATTFYIGVSDADNSLTATTNGTDGIYLWQAQNELGSFVTSPIVTTTAAVQRNGESLSYPTALNMSGTEGSVYVEASFVNLINANRSLISATKTPLNVINSTAVRFADGTTTHDFLFTISTDTVHKFASSWGSAGEFVAVDGVAPDGQTFDGDMNYTAAFAIGNTSMFGTARNVRIYPISLNPVKLKLLTAANDWGAPLYADLSDSRYLISANDERYRKVANGAR